MITKETKKHKTPNGGQYSEVYYFNNEMEPVDKSKATVIMVRELDKDKNLIFETQATI
jgi:hypothetical protein